MRSQHKLRAEKLESFGKVSGQRRSSDPIRSGDYLDEKITQHSGVTLRAAPIARRDAHRSYPEWADDVL